MPWAEPHSRFTLLMERFVIDAVQACQTVRGACTLVGISWDRTWHVLERAVARGLARKQATAIARIGVDEKAFRKSHRYLTMVNDVDRGTVEFVAESREKASLAAFYESRTPEQLAGIEAIAMDMWENRLLIAEDDDRLKGTKYLWISSKDNVHPRRRPGFRFLPGSDLKTARAWAIKENLKHLLSFQVEGWARRFFSQWTSWAMRSRLEPIKVLIYFYCGRWATALPMKIRLDQKLGA